jgi:peptidoglycan/LPS O-acetylase OafA/YrhL
MTTLTPDTRPSAGADPSPDARRARGHSRIRKDIEGLRAVACFLVLPYHAGLMLFPGGFVGVDVFFVISGFVITGQLLAEADRRGSVSLVGFFARRSKRLLPAAGLVLTVTAFLTWLWVPTIRWGTTGGDVVASALYYVNWNLADRSVDYLAEDVPPSPVQHYWSLSVEEQFYLLWPLLVLLALWIARRTGGSGKRSSDAGLTRRFKVGLLASVAVLAVPSLAWSAWMATNSPERAYFVTTTRLWEFAFGTAIAVVATRLDRMPRWAGAVLSWAGLGAILLSARLYHADMVWPGPPALLPILGATAFIAGGVAAGGWGPVRLIGIRPMLVVGYLTYSLYLWHWPLLIVAREHFDGISVTAGMVIVVLTAIPAWLTFKLVENPLRSAPFLSARPVAALGIGLLSMVVAVAAGLALTRAFDAASAPTSTGSARGAAVLSDRPTSDPDGRLAANVDPAAITPNPLAAPEDVPDLYADGCQTAADDATVHTCTYGADDAATTIAVVGDSKAAQWVPALQLLAPEHDWRIRTYTKSACPFVDGTVTMDGEPYQTCHDWGQDVLDRLTGDEKPDVVLTVQMRSTAIEPGSDDPTDTSQEAMEDAIVSTWRQLADAGVEVVSLADTPQTGYDVYACVAENPDDLGECTYDRQKGIDISGVEVQSAAAERAGVPFIDLNRWICPSAECPPVIGDVLVYRQGSHVTKTYIETLAPQLGRALVEAGVPA